MELKNHTELFPDNDAVLAVKEFMEEKKLMPNRFIAIGASASYPLKCWPMQNFHVLISDLIANRWPVVLVGGANEKENTQLEKEYRGEIHNTAGKLSPLESAELLKNARLVVTNDTSVSHLAEAVSTPVIVLFGSTVKEFGYAPFLEESQIVETKEVLNCRPCSRDGRGKCLNPNYLSCLTNITPQSVMTLIPESENKYTVLYED
jgi:heptosyltransferase-2